FVFFFSSRRRHTRSYGDWSSDVCSSDLTSRSATPWRRSSGWAWSRRPPRSGRRCRCRPPWSASTTAGTTTSSTTRRERGAQDERSEERRVGKECRTRRSEEREKENRGGE